MKTKAFAVFSILQFVFLAGCCDLTNSCPVQQTSPTSLITRCGNVTAVPGYVRTDSQDTTLAGCSAQPGSWGVSVFSPINGARIGQYLEVCADADLTSAESNGWVEWSDHFRDPLGCDGGSPRVKQHPDYKNVLQLKKTS